MHDGDDECPRASSPGPRHAERQAARKKRFTKMDADGNGKVTREQFLTYGRERFEAADIDDDGPLTFDEFRDFHRQE